MSADGLRIFKQQRLEEKPKFITEGDVPPRPARTHVGKSLAWDLHSGAMWSVAAASISHDDMTEHLAALTCEPNKGKTFSPGAKPVTFTIGHVADGRLYMPPWYARCAFPDADITHSCYTRGWPMREGVEFRGALMSHPPQQQAIARYGEWMAAHADCSPCIISLPCGYGKTVVFIYLAVALRRVTLVLAHKLPLVDQWIEEVRRFVPTARVGYIKSHGIRIDDVDIIVASTQSLFSHLESKRNYLPRLFERVGLLCMDEGHHAVASTFSQVFSACPAQYRIVLTATPRRKDGLMPHLQMIGGPVIFRALRQVGEVHVLCVEYVSEKHHEIKMGRGGHHINRQGMTNKLTEDANRTAIACAIIRILVMQGRRVLVVTPRVTHLNEVADLLDVDPVVTALPRRVVSLFVRDARPPKRRRRKTETEEEAGVLADAALHEWEDTGPHGHAEDFEAPHVGRVLEGMAQLDRELQYEGNVVLATSQMMEDGISIPALSAVVDLDNMSDSEQIIGRILRACPGKKVPLVVDMWIGCSIFKGLFWKRFAYCRDEGFAARHIKVETKEDLPAAEFWDVYDREAPHTL